MIGRIFQSLRRACVASLVLFTFGGVAMAECEPLEEEPIIAAAQKEVAITTTFAGDELFIYGAVARCRRVTEDDGPLDVIIVVEGPSEPLMVRKKGWVAGLWINSSAFRIAAAPSYYGVASTGPLAQILRQEEDAAYRISIEKAVVIAGAPISAQNPEEFRQAVLRLRRAAGLYVTLPDGVTIAQTTLFEARFELPANIVEGLYQTTVYLVRERRVVAFEQFEIPVQRRGLERFLYVQAIENPFLYGLGTLIAALVAGFLASELFRRVRRG